MADAELLPEIPVPLHVIHPQMNQTRHTLKEIIPWMVMHNIMEDLMSNLRISGIKGIKNAVARETERTDIDSKTGVATTVKEWVIDTEGTNLSDTMALHAIDDTNVISSSVMETYEEFGIDAAAHVLYQEIRTTMMAETRVDDRYIELLVDQMCFRGTPMAMSRHGINRQEDLGVLGKATFEETLSLLFDASAFSEFDPIKGVSEKIMLGQPIPIGTGSVNIINTDNGKAMSLTTISKLERTTRAETYVVQSYFPRQDQSQTFDSDQDMDDDNKVERCLVINNMGVSRMSAASTRLSVNISAVNEDLYEHHIFQPLPPTVAEEDIEDLPPFRPSSPSHYVDAMNASNNTGNFRPSSPSNFIM